MRHSGGQSQVGCAGLSGPGRESSNAKGDELYDSPRTARRCWSVPKPIAASVASNELMARINRAIAAGRLTNKAGRTVEKPLDGGLVRADKAVLYPIVDEIPMMLVDEGIPLDQPALVS